MWKWTEADNIKAIILDCDSLDDEFIEFKYDEIISNVKVFKAIFVYDDKELSGDVIDYIDYSSLINEVMGLAECESSSIVSISSNPFFMKNMMYYHIGTIYSGKLKRELLKDTPDFTYNNSLKLKKILSQEYLGYIAENIALNIKVKRRNILTYDAEIQLDNQTKCFVSLYFGGRYFSRKHHYLEDDPLSELLRAFKRKYYSEVDNYFDTVIMDVNRREPIDILTYVPLKPQDIIDNRFDRFKSLRLVHSNQLGVKLQSALKCVKDFTQKRHDYNSRQMNVKDAFKVVDDVSGKHVVVLDDLYTSGATIKEISKVLYENGARKVTAILLAVNQTTESSSVSYHGLVCSQCGSDMKLKMGPYGLFFGCSNYLSHVEEDTTIGVLEGLEKLKRRNRIESIDVMDLEDQY